MSRVACSRCGKRFGNPKSAQQHIDGIHKGKGEVKPYDPGEPSIGELVAEAQIARACGDPVDEWIAEMFDI